MSYPLKVVSRNSPLSLLQVKEVFSFFPGIHYQLFPLQTFGDKNKHIPLLPLNGADGEVPPDFFTRELDETLLRGEADVAVHSAKDLPYPLPPELELFALLEAADKTDALVSKNNLRLSQLPAGAKVGTSSAKRRAGLLACRPDLEVTGIRGTIEERIALVDSGAVDALIVAACALQRLNLEGRIAEILPFTTHPLQGHLAIVGRKNKPELKTLFTAKDIRKTYGKVTLAGFGPGNPDLLTIGAHKALTEAAVIFHDDLLDKAFLAQYPAEKVDVGKRKDVHRFHQEEINEMVYQAAVSGKRVVRLKGGDPMIFAHGREEIDFLQSRLVEVEVIAGISSGIALAAATHIPLTHRGVAASVAFVAGHLGEEAQTPLADTLVYYMGGANIAGIARKLIAAGRKKDTPAALVHDVSLPGQKVWYSSLQELQYSIVKYPTPLLIIVGDVVAFENGKPQKVLLTGTSGKDYNIDTPTHTPLIKIEKITDNKHLHSACQAINTFDWVIFTSRYGVRYFFEALTGIKLDIRALSNIKIASVGKTTSAELRNHQLYPDIEPEIESAEGLIDYFKNIELKNKQILLPRSDKGLRYLSEELERLGGKVVDIPAYRNTVNENAEKVDIASFEKIFFSSPSGVDAFCRIYGELPNGIQLIAKGETTRNRLLATN